MRRKSFWATLLVAALLASFASLHVAPVASASPAHATTHKVSLQYVAACTSGHLRVVSVSSNPSLFNNYNTTCVTDDECTTLQGHGFNGFVCLYQDANMSGQEIEFWGGGCFNLTDFGGPGPGGTWNDTVSSFRILPGSNTTGAFYWDTNDKGYYYLYGNAANRVSSTNYIGNTWNDQISSLEIDPNPNPNVC